MTKSKIIQSDIRNLTLILVSIFLGNGSLSAQLTTSEIRTYIKSCDSLYFHFGEAEQNNITVTGLLLSPNPNDTLEKYILQNIKGDTVYRVEFHHNIDAGVYEIYYLKDNILIAAKIELRESQGERIYYQKTTYYQNNFPFFKDSLIEIQSQANQKITGPMASRAYKYLPDLLPYKKEQLLTITKKYLPSCYYILDNYPAIYINSMAHGDSLTSYFLDYPTIIHEGFHFYEVILNSVSTDSFQHFKLNDRLTISIKKFYSFPSKRISGYMPGQLNENTRYDNYINSLDTVHLITQTQGFLGLLEEYTAYFQGLRAYIISYGYLRDSFKFNDPDLWLNYLNKNSSDLYAINEFKIFISCYLQYAKINNPELFKEITEDNNIKQLYTHIETESNLLIGKYLNNRKVILRQVKLYIKKQEAEHFLKGKDKLTFSSDFSIENLLFTSKILRQPQHKVLNLLRH